MSRLTIDTGTAGNSATGDSLRTAFTKVNTNFEELYAELGADGSLSDLNFTDNIISTDNTNQNIILSPNGTGLIDVDNRRIINVADPTSAQDAATKAYVDAQNVAQAITFVGDDSTGTAVNSGETFKIAGSGSVTTAVSGDTITITGATTNLGDFTFSGNKLSTTSSNADMELDPAGTGNLILKSGNFLPATDNNQYLGSVSKRWHTLYVGPGSININGVTISESGGSLQIPGGFTGTQGLASIILPDPNILPYGNQLDNLGAPFDFDTATIFYDHHTYLYIANKVASGGVWSGWTVGQNFPESLGFTPATFLHYSIGGALTQLILLTGGSGLTNVATDNVMAFRPGDPITTVLATPYSGVLGTVNSQGTSQPSLTTTSTLTSGGTFTAQDESLFFDNINLQSNANIVFSDSTTQNTAAKITVVGDDSTGVTLNAGETIRIAGTQNITTAVSGDTLTITGPDLSSYATTTYVNAQINATNTLTIADDSSTTSAINLDNTLQVVGATGISTAVNGSILTITGTAQDFAFSSLTSTPTTLSGYGITDAVSAGSTAMTIVGDDSSGTSVNIGETFKIAGTQNITTAISGDTLTITGPNLSSYLTSETSHADVVVDGDFGSQGIMLRGASSGTYSILTDNSSNWNTAFGWGNHASANYLTNSTITLVGDDSTGTTLNSGETFKIAGTQNITTAVSGDTLTITGPDLSSYVTENTNVTFNVLKIDDGVHEKFQAKADATGVVTHDCASGHIFYHTSPDADWTANFTNLNLSSGYATAVTLVIVQGGTGYYPSAVQIGGAAQTLNWQGNATPTPSSNRTDVVTFSIINNSGTYTVLGQLTGF